MKIRYRSDSSNLGLKIGTSGSAGIDLFCSESALVMPFCKKVIDLNFAIELPTGSFGFLTGRSSTRVKRGLDVVNGIIDSDYRGSLKAVFCNNTLIPRRIKKGDRLVQLILVQTFINPYDIEFERVDDLDKTIRDSNGFGSTGR